MSTESFDGSMNGRILSANPLQTISGNSKHTAISTIIRNHISAFCTSSLPYGQNAVSSTRLNGSTYGQMMTTMLQRDSSLIHAMDFCTE